MYCTYELQVTRKIGGLWYKYTDLPGIQVEVTINPSPAQVSAGEDMKPPGFWGPIFIDCEAVDLNLERALNQYTDPYTRRRPYHRSDIEYVEDSDRIEERRRLVERPQRLF